MNVQHFEKGFQYNDRELLYIARKVGKLATYCKRVKNEGSSIRVEAEYRSTEKKKDSFKVTITVDLPNRSLRAESRRSNPIEALERCTAKLEPQVKKYKDKWTGKQRAKRSKEVRKKIADAA